MRRTGTKTSDLTLIRCPNHLTVPSFAHWQKRQEASLIQEDTESETVESETAESMADSKPSESTHSEESSDESSDGRDGSKRRSGQRSAVQHSQHMDQAARCITCNGAERGGLRSVPSMAKT